MASPIQISGLPVQGLTGESWELNTPIPPPLSALSPSFYFLLTFPSCALVLPPSTSFPIDFLSGNLPTSSFTSFFLLPPSYFFTCLPFLVFCLHLYSLCLSFLQVPFPSRSCLSPLFNLSSSLLVSLSPLSPFLLSSILTFHLPPSLHVPFSFLLLFHYFHFFSLLPSFFFFPLFNISFPPSAPSSPSVSCPTSFLYHCPPFSFPLFFPCQLSTSSPTLSPNKGLSSTNVPSLLLYPPPHLIPPCSLPHKSRKGKTHLCESPSY